MDRFNELLIFLSVAEKGSFTAAAKILGITPSAVSKSISRQEDRLGVLLFHRSTRSIRLTDNGCLLYENGILVRDAMEAAEASARQSQSKPSGLLKIHIMPMLAKIKILPLVIDFERQYPEIKFEIHTGLEQPDPIRDGTDIVIRSGIWHGSDITIRRIGKHKTILCASEAYLSKYGMPKNPSDLRRHNCLYRLDRKKWIFNESEAMLREINVSGNISSTDSELLIEFARRGMGIIWVSEMMVDFYLRSGELIKLLSEYEFEMDSPIFIGYVTRRYLDPKIRYFIDYVVDNFNY